MRILTWNCRGSSAQCKKEELVDILNYWKNNNDPVEIICLQELSVTNCTIVPELNAQGYQCFIKREGYNKSGSNQLIAVSAGFAANKNLGSGIIDLHLDQDDKALNIRLPMYVKWSENGESGLIITYHAPLFHRTLTMLERLNEEIEDHLIDQYSAIYLAGDLNTDNPPLTGFTTGFSNHLDYILAWNGNITDGVHSESSCSDHLPISADF